MNLQEALIEGRNVLKELDAEAWASGAEILLSTALGKDRPYLFAYPDETINEVQYEKFKRLLEERSKGVPIAYLLGKKEFLSSEFEVNQHTLIPRPETEILIEKLSEVLNTDIEKKTILDVGTGSGVIAISLKQRNPHLDVYASDVSEEALKVCRRNSLKHESGIKLLQGSLASCFVKNHLDVIVANLPYIPQGELAGLEKDVRLYEPELALVGGPEGTELIFKLIEQAKVLLKSEGYLALELGINQSVSVSEKLYEQGFNHVDVIKDYSNIDRHIIAQK